MALARYVRQLGERTKIGMPLSGDCKGGQQSSELENCCKEDEEVG